jgi:PIN domain nuclease of toxin-antitoxin system
VSSFLLDTHVWLWMLGARDRLRSAVREQLEDAGNELLLSAASSWEIAIKYRLGRLQLPQPPPHYVPDRIRRTGTTPLPVEHEHVLRVAELPDHHRDPFDRLLVAQAQILRVPIITADRQLAAYEVDVVDA